MLSLTVPNDAEVEAMTDRQFTTYEAKVRRAAHRMGFVLNKSRRRDPRALDYGTYQLVDARTNRLEVGDHNNGYGVALNEVHAVLVSGTE